jgi:hypothetical protein
MPHPNRGGRPSIFGSKDGERIQGVLTTKGTVAFNQARQRLARLSGWEPEQVSDADVVIFLSLGEREALKQMTRKA